MTWLDPMAAIVAAGIGVPVLVALYVLRLRRRPLRVSSTLLWQSAAEDLQVNVPLRRLRASWLLLLHLLILGLLAAALGRPSLSAGAGTLTRLVVLIDRSASMACVDGAEGRTRLDEGRARAKEIATRAVASGASVAVVSFAARANVECGFTTSRAAPAAAIDSITPTDQPADLSLAIKVAESLLSDEGEERIGVRASVCVVSDGSLDASGLTLAGALATFEGVGTRGPDNVGIVSLSARRDYDDPGTVRVFVRLLNGAERAIDVPVSLTLDDDLIDRRAVHLPAAEAGPTDGVLRPGDGVTTFQLRTARGGAAVVRVERADALAADNEAATVIPPAHKPSVVLARPTGGAERPGMSPAWLLEAALAELDAESFRVIDGAEYERLASAGTFAGADLYVFDRVRPSRAPPAPSLSFGAGMPAHGLDLREPLTETDGTYVLAWERAHPLLRDVAMDQVFAARGLAAVPVPAGVRSDAKELATGASGPMMLLAADGPHRRLVVCFDLAASNWPLQVSFPVFLASAVDYLTLRAEESAGRAFTTAEPVEISAPAGAARVQLRPVVLSPGEASPPPITVAIAEPRTGQRSPAGLIERAGLYRVEPPGPEPMVAVNLVDANESACGVRTSLRLGAAAMEARHGPGVPREIWAWFLGAAGVLLVIEWVVFALRTRV